MTLVFASLYAVIVFTSVLTRTTAVASSDGLPADRPRGADPSRAADDVSFCFPRTRSYRAVLDGIAYVLPQLSGARLAIARHILNQPVEWGPMAQCLASGAGFFALGAWIFHRRDY